MKIRALLLAVLSLIVFMQYSCSNKESQAAPPPKVIVTEVIKKDVPVVQEFVGQTYGLFDIAIQARVEGFLESMHFEEGRRVREGQLLYTIDPQPFEAKVSGYQSQLAEAQTMLTKAESDLARIRPLAEMNAVSKSDLDAAVAQRDAAQASVEAAESSLRAARIELGYTKIYSPINGLIGKTEAYPGDFVGRGVSEAVLNEVSRIDTILVNFHIPEEQYLQITRPLLERQDSIAMKLKENRGQLTLELADGSTYPFTGQTRFVNRQVNPTTGTILLQAAFPNEDGLLRPGQFAKVKGVTDIIRDGLLIPQRCIIEIQGTYRVMVVNADDEVESRQIEVGPTIEGGLWVVTSGLEAGEKVIYEGLLSVSSGMKVTSELKEL